MTDSPGSSAPDHTGTGTGTELDVGIVPATMAHFRQVLDDHPRYWGEHDMRWLHLAALVHEFPATSLVALDDAGGIRAYLFGFVTPDHVGYIHLIATRDDARGAGLARRLYHAFADAARKQGALTLKAITSFDNKASLAFHRSLGFTGQEVEGYGGPGYDRVVLTRDLPPAPSALT